MKEAEALIGVMVVLVVILWMILFYCGVTLLQARTQIQRQIRELKERDHRE